MLMTQCLRPSLLGDPFTTAGITSVGSRHEQGFRAAALETGLPYLPTHPGHSSWPGPPEGALVSGGCEGCFRAQSGPGSRLRAVALPAPYALQEHVTPERTAVLSRWPLSSTGPPHPRRTAVATRPECCTPAGGGGGLSQGEGSDRGHDLGPPLVPSGRAGVEGTSEKGLGPAEQDSCVLSRRLSPSAAHG